MVFSLPLEESYLQIESFYQVNDFCFVPLICMNSEDKQLSALLEKIFSMAVHYYDEDDIGVGKVVSCQVAVNHIVELTEEEKDEARQEAIK